MEIRVQLTEEEHALVREAAALESVTMRAFARQSTLRHSRRVLADARRKERNAAAGPTPVTDAAVHHGAVSRMLEAVLRAGRRA